MDWHYTYPRGLPNPYGVSVEGWTGHTVYPYLFPEPLHFAKFMAKRGVHLMFNHHHAAGVQFHEAVYPTFAKALGVNPTTGATLEFDIANLTWTNLYFREVIKPLEDMGVNLDWQDFQQQPIVCCVLFFILFYVSFNILFHFVNHLLFRFIDKSTTS
jgi:hypothetical protein